MKQIVTASPWNALRDSTPARLALGRVGEGLPTDEVLRFGWAHASARDAIQSQLDLDSLEAGLIALACGVERVSSRAPDRATYLRRPDLGRQLDSTDAARLRARCTTFGTGQPIDLCIIIADGLSPLAVQRHAAPLLEKLKPLLPPSTHFSPVVLARQARVALGDEIGEAFRAQFSVVLIGERPGLSSPDSLGIYLTHAPIKGRTDAQRNCISNVRPQGLSYQAAAYKLAWLIQEAKRLGLTGVDVKDASHLAVIEQATQHAIS